MTNNRDFEEIGDGDVCLCAFHEDSIMDMEEVLFMTSLNPEEVEKEINAGRFPKPYNITPTKMGFSRLEYKRWHEGCKSKRVTKNVVGLFEEYEADDE